MTTYRYLALAELGRFTGTAAELLERVTPEKPPKGWPTTAMAELERAGWAAPIEGGCEVDGAHRRRVWAVRSES